MATIERGHRTRARILAVAERAMLDKGFGATSIDEIVTAAELTRGGFFYHFRNKNDLALALLQRYIDTESEMQDQIMAWAFRRTEDPLQACLIGLKMYAQYLANSSSANHGRMVATLCYHECLFQKDIRALYQEAAKNWRTRFIGLLNQITSKYKPRDAVSIEHLADAFPAITEGGIILSRVHGDPQILPQQILIARSYLKLMFAPDPTA